MVDEAYAIPDNPEFEDGDIRALKTSDPANAEIIFNPLFMRILCNIRAVWQKTITKVDKVDGKGLSANDYTNEEKQKLAGLVNYNDESLRNSLTTQAEAIAGNVTAIAKNVTDITAANSKINAISSTPLTMTAQLTAGGAQDLAMSQVRNVTISPSEPSGGANGDMWFKYTS